MYGNKKYNTLFRFHGTAFSTPYTVDRDICMTTIQKNALLLLNMETRHDITLLATYIAYLFQYLDF
jgi:hypothetical protein